MTAFHRRSRGKKHSRTITASPRWDEYLRTRKQCARKCRMPEPDDTRGWLLLAEKAWGRAVPRLIAHLLRPARYSDEAIREQLRQWYLAGYVQALRDVKRERERIEDASYQDAIGTVTLQEAETFSHRYDREW